MEEMGYQAMFGEQGYFTPSSQLSLSFFLSPFERALSENVPDFVRPVGHFLWNLICAINPWKRPPSKTLSSG